MQCAGSSRGVESCAGRNGAWASKVKSWVRVFNNVHDYKNGCGDWKGAFDFFSLKASRGCHVVFLTNFSEPLSGSVGNSVCSSEEVTRVVRNIRENVPLARRNGYASNLVESEPWIGSCSGRNHGGLCPARSWGSWRSRRRIRRSSRACTRRPGPCIRSCRLRLTPACITRPTRSRLGPPNDPYVRKERATSTRRVPARELRPAQRLRHRLGPVPVGSRRASGQTRR